MLITQSSHSSIRALVYAAIQSFAEVLSKATSTPQNKAFFDHAVEFVTQSAMNLVTHCVYDPEYFADFCTEYDEELEIERNDIRDLMRTVTQNSSSFHFMLQQCHLQILASPPGSLNETAVHALSAFAKNLLLLTQSHQSLAGDDLKRCFAIADLALECQNLALERCISLVNLVDPATGGVANLPASFQSFRVTLLAGSVFVVWCNALLNVDEASLPFPTTYRAEVHRLVRLSTEFACLSAVRVKEFPQDVVDVNVFVGVRESEVSGAFHSPGGEDHVGLIVLYRLCCEDGQCATIMTHALQSLLQVHQHLFSIEQKRAGGMMATSKSRRLALKSIGKVCLIDEKFDTLRSLVEERTSVMVAVLGDQTSSGGGAEGMFRLCEAVLDLGEFDVTVINSNMDKISSLAAAIYWGYEGGSALPYPVARQWARLRGAFLRLLNSSCERDAKGSLAAQKKNNASVANNQGIAPGTMEMALRICAKECEAAASAVVAQSRPDRPDFSLFDNAMIGVSMVEAGCFLDLVLELANGDALAHAFLQASGPVTQLLTFHHGGGGSGGALGEAVFTADFEDPRLSIGEVYYKMGKKVCEQFSHSFEGGDDRLLDALAAMVHVVLLEWLNLADVQGEKEGRLGAGGGMDFDDSVTLVIFDFLGLACTHQRILEKVGALFGRRYGPKLVLGSAAEAVATYGEREQAALVGSGAVLSAMMSAASGRLAPWAIEFMPKAYESIFNANNSNLTAWSLALKIGIECKIVVGSGRYAVLSGKYVSFLKDKAMADYVTGVNGAAKENNAAGWHKVKNLLKLACGGKKKKSGFKLKPSKRMFCCDRI